MKIAQHFRAFLERHDYLQLSQIGRFEVVAKTLRRRKRLFGKWINFSADKNQATDPELVAFISNSMKVESLHYCIRS